LRLSLRAVNESSKTPAVFLWATEDVSFGREGSQHHAQFRGPPRSNWKECDMPARRSTLAEALEASLLLFVVDASDPTYESQLEVSRSVLHEIGAEIVPSRLLLNKIDRVSEADRDALRAKYPDAILLSAKSPEDVAA